jgi:hypothetical protein
LNRIVWGMTLRSFVKCTVAVLVLNQIDLVGIAVGFAMFDESLFKFFFYKGFFEIILESEFDFFGKYSFDFFKK